MNARKASLGRSTPTEWPAGVGQRAEAQESGGGFHIPSLDGIRAISFLTVFAAHATSIAGGLGVTVFFFLSGYLITTLLRLEFQKYGKVSLRNFYLRRVLRIFPPFYTVLILAALLSWTGLLPGGVQAKAVIAQLAHVANYWNIAHGFEGQPAGTGVYWSLAVEEHFYLLFPGLFLVLQRLLPEKARAQSTVLWGLCAVVLAWRLVLVFGLGALPNRTHLATDTRLDSILFGCALAIGNNPIFDRSPRSASSRNALLLFGGTLFAVSLVIRQYWFLETARYTLQGVALTPLFIVAIKYPDWGPLRWLNLSLVRHLGELSFTLYLVHHVVLDLVSAWLPSLHGLASAFVALAISIAFAETMLRAIERPCAQLRRRLSHSEPAAARPPRYGSV